MTFKRCNYNYISSCYTNEYNLLIKTDVAHKQKVVDTSRKKNFSHFNIDLFHIFLFSYHFKATICW